MLCRICSKVFNGDTKLIDSTWEDLVNAILPQLVLDTTSSSGICRKCYGKLRKFNHYRNLYSQNEHLFSEKANILCRICKIDASNTDIISTRHICIRDIHLLKIFIPEMHVNWRVPALICGQCQDLLTEFGDFLHLLVFNEPPKNCDDLKNKCDEKYEENSSCKLDSPETSPDNNNNNSYNDNNELNKQDCVSIGFDSKSELDDVKPITSRRSLQKCCSPYGKIEKFDTNEETFLCASSIETEEIHIKTEANDLESCDKELNEFTNENCDNANIIESNNGGDRDKKDEVQNYIKKSKNGKYNKRTEKIGKSDRISFLCYYCRFAASTQKDLANHHKINHKEELVRHQCPHCQYHTTQRKYLTTHYRYSHNENTRFYNCSLCNFKTKRQEHLKTHLNKHYGTSIHKCYICGFETKWKYSLQCHIIVKHDDRVKYIKCDFCDFKSKMKNDMKKHLQYKHNSEKYLKCPQCSFRTNFQSWLNKHVKNQHIRNIWYECPQCKYQTKSKDRLKKHVRLVHSENNTLYSCPLCDHKTKYRENLKIHHKCRHESDCETFGCSHCPYRAKMKGDLRKHIAYQHSTVCKYYDCPHCLFKSKKMCHVKDHIKFQHSTNFELHKCPHCSHMTKYKDCLRIHIKNKHEDDNKYHECKYCKHKTKYKSNLKLHYKVRHSQYDQEQEI